MLNLKFISRWSNTSARTRILYKAKKLTKLQYQWHNTPNPLISSIIHLMFLNIFIPLALNTYPGTSSPKSQKQYCLVWGGLCFLPDPYQDVITLGRSCIPPKINVPHLGWAGFILPQVQRCDHHSKDSRLHISCAPNSVPGSVFTLPALPERMTTFLRMKKLSHQELKQRTWSHTTIIWQRPHPNSSLALSVCSQSPRCPTIIFQWLLSTKPIPKE